MSDYDKGRDDGRREVLDLIRDRDRWSEPTSMEIVAEAVERELGYECQEIVARQTRRSHR